VGLVEPAAHRGQHRVPGHDHHRARRVARDAGLAFERGQRRLRLPDPAQLHQRHESPEDAAALEPQIRGSAGQVDDLAGRGEPVLRPSWIPQRVQPRVEDLGEYRPVTAAAGQGEGLLDEDAAPGRDAGVAEQPVGQPCFQPGAGGVVTRPGQRRLQQPDQPGVDLEEALARRRAQGECHDRITARVGVDRRRQRAGRAR
jgi:hypothetical protein